MSGLVGRELATRCMKTSWALSWAVCALEEPVAAGKDLAQHCGVHKTIQATQSERTEREGQKRIGARGPEAQSVRCRASGPWTGRESPRSFPDLANFPIWDFFSIKGDEGLRRRPSQRPISRLSVRPRMAPVTARMRLSFTIILYCNPLPLSYFHPIKLMPAEVVEGRGGHRLVDGLVPVIALSFHLMKIHIWIVSCHFYTISRCFLRRRQCHRGAKHL